MLGGLLRAPTVHWPRYSPIATTSPPKLRTRKRRRC